MPNPTNRSYLGVAKEATKGTGVAATAFIPVKTINPFDHVMYLPDKGLRGSMVETYDEIQGPIYSEIDLGGDTFPDTIGWFLAGVLPDVATTGASAPFTTTFASKNTGDGQGKAYTITDFYGMGAASSRQFAGCQFSEVTLKGSAEGLLEWTAKAMGWPSTVVANPTQSFTTVTPAPVWVGQVTIAGVAKLFLESVELTIKRPVNVLHTLQNTQNPYGVWQGPISVTGKMTIIHEDDTELTRYLTNTKPTWAVNFQQGAGAALTQIQVTMSKCAYTSGKVVRGKDWIESEYALEGLGNTTDVGATAGYSPCKVQLQNAVAASTYV